ncbi:MAG: chemotaxis protein CheC [Clostridia bacterium]|nr:chemotaxis protein CheC [Clostridia bacterium]
MFKSYDDLSDVQIDVLREIGNIGAGNAATALATILNEKVDISVPKVRISGFDEAVNALGGAETLSVGVLVDFFGEARGMMMFLLKLDEAKNIMDVLIHDDDGETDENGLSEMKLSAIKEVGNILSASYINSLSVLTGLTINVSIPGVAIDMVGALMDVPIIEFGSIGDKVMFIEESFLGETNDISSNIIMFAEMETLKVIMERLGLEL